MLTLQSNPETARFCFPVEGGVGTGFRYRISTQFNAYGFGYANIRDRLGRFVHHTGIDLNRGSGNQDEGDNIYATADGVVSYVGFQRQGFGNFLVIKHSGGIPLWERHAHLKQVFVSQGQEIKQGQLIGTLGKTGDPKAEMLAHLHFDYLYVNPEVLPGDFAHWPGADEQALLKAYTDPLKVWSKWGVMNPSKARLA